MYHATITADKDASALEELFKSEDKNIGRASFSVEKCDEKIIISLQAQDAVALRAVVDSVAKTLIIWEKGSSLKK
jgi:tRNA threonylcarbamoyladenosine modification (KEOPS) complex  Pcc1 subunit